MVEFYDDQRRLLHGVVYDEYGCPEPVVEKLTEEEAADDTIAPVWVVEIWQVLAPGGKAAGRWMIAADFKKHGATVPVTLEKAVAVAKKRQSMRSDFVYRVRNLKSGADILAAVL